ncbi:MAG: prepilin-type N-terminal cleavage/methylation domain-containing protein [Azonexus sp.]
MISRSRRAGWASFGGFTLIELMVALGIFMVLGMLSYRSLGSIIDSRDRVGVEQQRWLAITRFMQRLELDLQQIPLNLPDALLYDANNQTLRLIRLAPNGLGDEARTVRYRWRGGRIERDERRIIAPPLLKDVTELSEAEVVLESALGVEWFWPASRQGSGAGIEWQVPPVAAGTSPPDAIGLRIRLAGLPGEVFRVLALR